MAERVYILDTTLRDGEQMPGVNLNLSEKLEIALQLEKLGVDVIEAGFPAASPGDFEAVQAVAGRVVNCAVTGLCRAVPGDIERCAAAIRHAAHPLIHIFIATSDLHMKYKLRMQPEEVLERSVEAVKQARNLCPDVAYATEDGTRTDREFLFRVIEAVIDAGARTINIPDTVGYATPEEYFDLIRSVREQVPNIDKARLSVHCHNDLGLAVANTLAGLKAGARQLDCTINGLGERAGNAALEEVVMAMATRQDCLGFETGVVTRRIYRTSRMVESLTAVPIPPNKAVVGENAFRHESGIHQHGVMANRSTYEVMTPESIGVVHSGMALGKLSGRHAFAERLQALGYNLEGEELDQAFSKFKVLADRKKEISDRDLEAIAGHKASEVAEIYALDSFQLQSGNKIDAIASVKLIYKGETLSEAAVGDGPVDAIFKAVDKIVGLDVTLEAYGIKAVTEGKDALGEVTVRVSYKGETYSGRGLAVDVIESSVRAYIAAINRVLSELPLE